MKVVAIIPARGGSKGVPGKNIKMLGDKPQRPLIEYTINSAKKSKYVDKIIVSTDDDAIEKISSSNGVDVLRRHPNFADDFTPVIPDVVDYVIDQLDENYDIILVLEPTYPFRKPKSIDRVVEKVIEDSYDWVVTVSRVREHPYRARLLKGDEIIPFIDKDNIFSQRQDLPDVYYVRGAVYGAYINKIYNKNNLKNLRWGGVIINDIEAVDIDEPIDFIIAEGIVRHENE